MAKGLFVTGTGTDVGKTFITALLVKELQEAGKKAAYYKAAMSGNQRMPYSAAEETSDATAEESAGAAADETVSAADKVRTAAADETAGEAGKEIAGEALGKTAYAAFREEISGGMLIPGDAAYVKKISGISQSLASMCPYVYERAVSPHLAARIESEQVELDRVVEGYEALCESYEYVTMEGSGGIVCPIRFNAGKAPEEVSNIMLEDIVSALELPCIIVADAGLGTINSVVLTAEYMRRRGIEVKGLIFNRFHPGDIMEEDNIEMCRQLTGIDVIACVGEGAESLGADADILEKLYK